MSCRYKEECPSYSGWCEGPKQDFSRCVEFLIKAYENEKEKNAGLLIFKVNHATSTKMLMDIREQILKQIEDGNVMVVPSYIDVLTDIPKGCEIKVFDKDGKEIQ